ncbi:MAG: hypothetical protein LBR80_17185 [Deltaproteobacteria bacterium]|nr:hypothetical protein [Deltaproteobacteria bacterium]
MLKKLLFLTLLLFLAAATAVAILIFAWYKQWPPSLALIGPAVFLGLPLLWATVKLVGGFIARWGYGRMAGASRKPPPTLKSREFSVLRLEWERGAVLLRSLGRRGEDSRAGGKPLFMAVGPSFSGATLALRGSGLAVGAEDVPGSLGRGEGCDWYFFERAVYVAVHGLYRPLDGRSGTDGGADGGADPEREKAVLVDLLAGTGRMPPLQGILVAVPARLLRPESERELKDLGLQTWSLLNRLATDLDFMPPVYVLVTLLDDDRGWGAAMSRLERGGVPAGCLAPRGRKAAVGVALAERVAEAVETEFLGILDDLLEEEPPAIGACLPVYAETGSLRRPLSVFFAAMASSSPASPPIRIEGAFAARIPRELDTDYSGPDTGPEGQEQFMLSPAYVSPASTADPGGPHPALQGSPAGSGGLTAPGASSAFGTEEDVGPGGARPGRAVSGRDPAIVRSDGTRERRVFVNAALPESGEADAPGLRELLGRIIPDGAGLSRPLHLAWGPRQKRYLTALSCLYAVLLGLAVLCGMNVGYQRGLAEAARAGPERAETADPSRIPAATPLAKASGAWMVLDGVEEYVNDAGFRGIGPDRTGEITRDLQGAFEMYFERALEDLLEALNLQLESIGEPGRPVPGGAAGGLPPSVAGSASAGDGEAGGAPAGDGEAGGLSAGDGEAREPANGIRAGRDREIFNVTFRQLTWLYSYFMDPVKGDDPASTFPLISMDFEGETAPFWNLSLARLLGHYLDGMGSGPSRETRTRHVMDQLALAIARAVASSRGEGLDWLTGWCASLPDPNPIDLRSFWQRYRASEEVERALPAHAVDRVPYPYTSKGRGEILSILELLADVDRRAAVAAAGPGAVAADREASATLTREAAERPEYLERYERDYLSTWHGYKRSFEAVVRDIYDSADIESIYGQHNVEGVSPYASFAQILYDNLVEFAERDGADPWLLNVALDRAVSIWSESRSQGGIHGIIERMNSAAGASPPGGGGNGGTATKINGTEFMEKINSAERAYSLVLDFAQTMVADMRLRPDDTLRLAVRFFGGVAAKVGPSGGAPTQASALFSGAGTALAAPDRAQFQAARAAIERYAAAAYPEPGGGPPDDLYFRVRTSQLEAIGRLIVTSAAETLDSRWQSEVAHPLSLMDPVEARKALYGQGGLLAGFVDVWAKPFLEDSCADTCRPRVWEGKAFPFTEDFLSMAASVRSADVRGPAGASGAPGPSGAGASGSLPGTAASGGFPGSPVSGGATGAAPSPLADSYAVALTVYAAETDPGATEKPLRTAVTITAEGQVQTLVNYNYPVSETFVWKPGVPAAVAIEIQLPSVSLYVNYNGPDGFPDFISDLASGGFTLTPADFPEHEAALKAMGITRIDVSIRADGALPAVHALRITRTPIPESIVKDIVPVPTEANPLSEAGR